MPFAIRFHGLVCHYQDALETAIFVAGPLVPKHELRLVVNDHTDVINASFPEDTLFVKNPGGRSFRIAGHLALGGAIPQVRTTTFDFQKSVPSLAAMSTCTKVRPEVQQRKVTADILGYLDHPGGAFSVDAFYPLKARVSDGHAPELRCVASIVRLTLQSGAAPISIMGNLGALQLKSTATIDVYNAIVVPVPGATNMHFHHYNAIFDAGCGLKAQPIEQETKCENGGDHEQSPGAECSNSHVP